MALACSKQFCLSFSKNGKRNLFSALGSNFQNVPSVAHYSDTPRTSKEKLSKVMKAYLEKAVKYDKFMKEQLEEYNLGKKHLANMMGVRSKELTQEEVDKAIDYLLPSGLYVPKARPMMKPPEEIFRNRKEAMFDYTGRPYHFLFYTSKPNFSQSLHDAASALQDLNSRLFRGEVSLPLTLPVGDWYSREELEKLFLEKIYELEYEKFVEVFTRLSEHPLASFSEDLIKKYWKQVESKLREEGPAVVTKEEGGVKVVKVEGVRKKWCTASVTVKFPGTGEIRINNLGIEYFHNIQRREQRIAGEAGQQVYGWGIHVYVTTRDSWFGFQLMWPQCFAHRRAGQNSDAPRPART